MDLVFAPIELADSSLPAERLIELAQEGGPGINELRGLLDIIQDGIDKSYGSQNLLPSMLLTLGEGVIGAGPGGTMNWDNRFDVSVQLRWNLTRIFTADQQRQLARSKQNQALFSYHDLQGKLAAGVREARDAIHNGRLIIGLALNQIKESNTNYRQSNERLDGGVPNAMSEVALSIRALDLAHFNHLRAINEHNKAQIRLLLLMGDNAIPPMKAEVPPMSVPQRTSRPTGFGIDPAQGRQLPKPRQLPEELD
jgi:outer membrane protein TolC